MRLAETCSAPVGTWASPHTSLSPGVRQAQKLTRNCVCKPPSRQWVFHRNARVPHEGGHGAYPQPLWPLAVSRGNPRPATGGIPQPAMQREFASVPRGRQLSASVTAQSSTTHSQDTVQSNSVTPSPQSDHSCQGQSPELSTFKHYCPGPFPSMPEARCSLCSEETDREAGSLVQSFTFIRAIIHGTRAY